MAIKAIRQNLEMSQLEFAVALQTTPTTVSRWERGLSEPELTIVQVKRLCRIAGLTLEQLPDKLSQPAHIDFN